MWETPKRGKGLVRDSITMRDIYKKYKADCKINGDECVDYKLYAKIIKAVNAKTVNLIINEAEVFRLPYRLGEIQVRKYRKSFDLTQTNYVMNYKRSKENGFVIFHEDRFIYRWFWAKRGVSKTKHITWYKFHACRNAKRMVPVALKEKKDFFR
jgi:hypothetical protein